MKKVFLLFILILFSACTQTATVSETAIGKCIALCQEEKSKDIDLSIGPCLSNSIAEDWVCDLAHSPRIDVDNQPENQCSAFREGKAHHFVEVDENCNLIKVY